MELVLIATLCMLVSAFGHALMNTVNKEADDKFLFRGMFLATSIFFASPFVFFIPLPNAEAFKHLLISMVLHGAYNYALVKALERGDMSVVYPIMRGFAPLLAAVGAFFVLREHLSLLSIVALIGAAGVLIAFAWPSKGYLPQWSGIRFALLTSFLIAAYSINDAAGVRAMGNAFHYIVWFFMIVSMPTALVFLFLRRKVIVSEGRKMLGRVFLVSFAGAMSFGLALYAFSIAPVAQMSAMRETSVVFGAILAALVLKEPFGAKRILLSIVLAMFLILLQIGEA